MNTIDNRDACKFSGGGIAINGGFRMKMSKRLVSVIRSAMRPFRALKFVRETAIPNAHVWHDVYSIDESWAMDEDGGRISMNMERQSGERGEELCLSLYSALSIDGVEQPPVKMMLVPYYSAKAIERRRHELLR